MLTSHSVILGEYWTEGATVTLTIDDPTTGPGVDFTDSLVVPADGEVVFDVRELFQLQPGQIVTLSDGPTTKEVIITSLMVNSVDPDADTISGTADPGAEVTVKVEQEDELAFRYPTADTEGNWTADFSEDGGGPVVDIACTGQSSCCRVKWHVDRFDEDGDSTAVEAVYGPEFQVRRTFEAVWSSGWMVDSTVTLAIDDDNDLGNGVLYTASQTTEPSPWGMWFDQHAVWAFFWLEGIVDIETGYVVRTNDDFCYREHTVKNLTVTNVDLEADTFSGLADPYVSLRAGIHDEPKPTRWVEADESGHWSADFSDPAGGDTFDINLETIGFVEHKEDDFTSTFVDWSWTRFIVSIVSPIGRELMDLVDEGTLKPSQANGLIRPLENAYRSLQRGKTNPACSQLQDFVDAVNDKISDGVLSPEEGQPLIDAATDARDALGCNL